MNSPQSHPGHSPSSPFTSIIPFIPGIYLINRVLSLHFSQPVANPELILADWKLFRNAFYAFYAAAFIFIGLKTLVYRHSSENSLLTSKLILSLIFTTFSFALAGLLVDFATAINYFFRV